MKNVRVLLFLATVALAIALAPVIGALFAVVSILVIGTVLGTPRSRLCATLATAEILADTLDAFKVAFPMLKSFGTDFSSETVKKDQQVIAHIASVPSVQDYDGTTGFQANAADVTGLFVDVPITMNKLRHVPVKIAYLSSLASKKDLYKEAVRNIAYALGKDVVDYGLSLAVAANFSYSATAGLANTSKDTLDAITKDMNSRGAAAMGRFGIVNGDVYNKLEEDARIASGDYHGQKRTSGAYGRLSGVSGFENIWEYPSLPSTGNMTGFFGDRRAIVFASRLPNDIQQVAADAGVPAVARFETMTDPDSGLSFLGIAWQQQGTFDVYLTIAALFGASAGKQGGAAAAICDKAGVILKTG